MFSSYSILLGKITRKLLWFATLLWLCENHSISFSWSWCSTEEHFVFEQMHLMWILPQFSQVSFGQKRENRIAPLNTGLQSSQICVPQSINFIVLLPKKDAFCNKLKLKDTLSIKLWPKSFLWSNIEFWRRLNGLFSIEWWNQVKITMTTEFRFVQVNANPNTVSCKKTHAHFLSTAHSVVRYNLEVLIHHCRTAVPTMSYPGKLESPSVISNWNS